MKHRRRLRTDTFTTVWMCIAVVMFAATIGARIAFPQPLWTLIHIITVGVLTNAILQWSWYFARAFLRLPETDKRSHRDATVRQLLVNVAFAGLCIAMWRANFWSIIAGAFAIGCVIAWHGIALTLAARASLGGRFSSLIRYYIAASAFLVLGCIYAGIIAAAMIAGNPPDWAISARDGVTLAHAIVNIGGWIGLTIEGTIVTLGPTIVRTRIEEDSLRLANRALLPLCGSLVVAMLCALGGVMWGVSVGLLVYGAVVGAAIGAPLARALRAKKPSDYASWSVSGGMLWTAVAFCAIAISIGLSNSPHEFRSGNYFWIALLGVAGILQILIGALSYLMPVVIGGGPAAARRGNAVLNTAGPTRVAGRNTAILLLACVNTATPSLVSLWWVLVLITYAADIVFFAWAGMAQSRAARDRGAPILSYRSDLRRGTHD